MAAHRATICKDTDFVWYEQTRRLVVCMRMVGGVFWLFSQRSLVGGVCCVAVCG